MGQRVFLLTLLFLRPVLGAVPRAALAAVVVAAGMEGAAFVERLGIERLEQLGLDVGPTVYATGGGDDYRIIYLDADSNNVVMVEQPGISPMTQAPVTQKVYIDSYMETGEFNMPQTMRIMYDDELFGTGTLPGGSGIA